MDPNWHKYIRSGILALLLAAIAGAEESSKKTEAISITPKVPEKQFAVPVIPKPLPTQPEFTISVADVGKANADVASRLNLAMKEIRLVAIWSLDPSLVVEDQAGISVRRDSFHGFQTLGRKELRNGDEIQDLLHAVVLAIAHGPEEANECFAPRHGLRIFTKTGSIDMVICYECLQGQFQTGDEIIWFTTTKEAEPTFDSIFVKLGLRKAE